MASNLQQSSPRVMASQQVRRDPLWNVQEPGDPYDIKKSMIAKLPGGKKFMGDNLEIVCLLQAAELERLNDFLESYKIKFRDLERNQLDRHSYEVQIKELIQKIEDLDFYERQNQKLKGFVQSQTNQNDLLRESLREKISDKQLSNIYQQSQETIQQLKKQNSSLKESQEGYARQIRELTSRLQSYERAKIKEIQEIKQNYKRTSSYEKEMQENEQAMHLFKLNVESKLEKMNSEIKYLRGINDSKVKEINMLKEDNLQLQNRSKLTRSQPEQQLEALKNDYETKLASTHQQIVRLTFQLDEAHRQNQNLHRDNLSIQEQVIKEELLLKDNELRLKNREDQISQLNEFIRSIESFNNQPSQQLQITSFQQETTIKKLHERIDSLSKKLEAEELSSKMTKEHADKHMHENYAQLQELIRQNDQLRREALENSETKRQLVHLQSERAVLIQDIERQQQLINSKNHESNQNRALTAENQTLKVRINQIEGNLDFQHQSELIKLRTEYEHKIRQLSSLQGNQLQSRSFLAEEELKRYKELLREKTEEAERNRVNAFEWQTKYTQLEINYNYKTKNAGNGNSQLEMKLAQAQNRAAILEQQIKRINQVSRRKDEEHSQIYRRLKVMEDQIAKRQFQDSQRGTQYAQTLSVLRAENEDLRRNNHSSASTEAINQINRLNSILRSLQEEKQQLDNRNRQLAYELQYQHQNYGLINREKEDLRRTVLELQTKNKNISSQSEANFRRIQFENENLTKQLTEMRLAVNTYEGEVSRKINLYEQQIHMLTRQAEDSRMRLRQLQPKVSQYSLELQNLNQKHRYKSEEYNSMEVKYRTLSTENQHLRSQLKQQEIKVEKEVSQKYNSYETTIYTLSREQEESRRRYIDLENKHNQLLAEYHQLTSSLRKVTQDNDNLRRTTSQREGLVSNIKSEVDRTIQQYEISISNLSRNNEDLQRRLNEKDMLLRQKAEEYLRLEANINNSGRQLQHFKNRYRDLQMTMSQKLDGEVYQKYVLYDQTITKLADQNQELRRKLNQSVIQINSLRALSGEVQHLKRTVSNYESSIAIYEKEVSQKVENYERQRRDLQRSLQKSNQASKRVGHTMEDQVANLSRELERITLDLRRLEGQNRELKMRLKDSGEAGKAVAELQSKLAITSQQLERSSQNLRAKIEEFNKLEVKNRNLMIDLQTSRRQQIQLETHYNNTFENEVNRKQQTYHQSISELKRRISDLQAKIQAQNMELERMGNIIRAKGNESTQITINYRNIQSQYEEFKRRAKETELINGQNLMVLRKQNEDLRARFQEYEMGIRRLSDESNRKMVDYENKIALLKSEQERIAFALEAKTNELNKAIKYSKEMEFGMVQKTQYDTKTKQQLEATMYSLHQQNQDLKRKLHELSKSNMKIPEYEQRIKQLIQENEQLQQNLRVRTEALNNNQNRLRQYAFEVEQSNRRALEIEQSLINKYEMEVNMKSKNFEQNMTSLSQERQNLQRKMMDHQATIFNLTKEIQRLNGLIRGKAEQLQRLSIENEHYRQNYSRKLHNSENELNNMRINYEKLVNEYQQSKTHIQKYQSNTEKLHSEFERLQVGIEELKKQRQALFEKNFSLSDQIQRLTEQNKDLEMQTRDIRLRLADESSLQKRINQHLGLMVVLFAQIETLRQRVEQKEKEVEYVRRASLSPNILKH